MTLPLSDWKYPLSPDFMELTFYTSTPLYGLIVHFLNYTYTEPYWIYSFMSGFLCSRSGDASTWQGIAVLISFHFRFSSYKYRAVCSCLQMPMSTWVVSSLRLLEQCPATFVCISWSACVWGSVGCRPRSGIAGSSGTASAVIIMAHCLLECRSNLHSPQQCMRIPVAPQGHSQACLFPSRMAQTMFNIHLWSY